MPTLIAVDDGLANRHPDGDHPAAAPRSSASASAYILCEVKVSEP